jgi:hypothetical protein
MTRRVSLVEMSRNNVVSWESPAKPGYRLHRLDGLLAVVEIPLVVYLTVVFVLNPAARSFGAIAMMIVSAAFWLFTAWLFYSAFTNSKWWYLLAFPVAFVSLVFTDIFRFAAHMPWLAAFLVILTTLGVLATIGGIMLTQWFHPFRPSDNFDELRKRS